MKPFTRILIGVAFMIVGALGAAAQANASLGPATNFQLGGSTPLAIAAADFNGDGKLDLATADSLSNEISILPGNGAGGFGMSIETTTGTSPRSLSAGDLNSDGKMDLAVGNFSGTSAQIFLGLGNGNFQSPINEATGTGVSAVKIAELVGNANADLALVNYSTGKVSVFAGFGDGTFASPVIYPVESYPQAVGVADFNGDGRNDVAVANSGGDSVSVILSIGGGTGFGPTVGYPTPAGAGTGLEPSSIVTDDLNGDGKNDLSTANKSSDDVSFLAGRGDGTFETPKTFPAGDSPNGISVGKLTDDPNPDIATAIPGTNMASLLSGNGLGSFGAPQSFIAGGSPRSTWTGDLNGDGNPDLALANSASDSVSVLLNVGPVATAEPAGLDFGSQAVGATSVSKKVMITNMGGDLLQVAGVSLNGTDASSFKLTAGTCAGASLANAAACEFEVQFSPPTAGKKDAGVQLDYNGAQSPKVVPVTGTAIASGAIKCKAKQKKKRGRIKSLKVNCSGGSLAASSGKKFAWKLKKRSKVVRKGKVKAKSGKLIFKVPRASKLKKGRYSLSVNGNLAIKVIKVR